MGVAEGAFVSRKDELDDGCLKAGEPMIEGRPFFGTAVMSERFDCEDE